MANAFDVLQARGFIQQCTDEEGLRKKLDSESCSFYVGVDPTGISMHVGHMVPLFAMAHLQRAGHKPIALVGGGTGLIGDPSGKTEMRKMLSLEDIQRNVAAIKKQIGRIVDFSDGNARLVNNYEWLGDLNYIEFLRDIGKHFSVNRMLTFESYKKRMETGLSFIEFNYQLLQSYDFYILNRDYGCSFQIGGDDQWGNIVAGVELIRRLGGKGDVYGLTFPLVTRSDGKKMGKTEKGAVFLDPELFPVFEFYQYWRNVSDADVEKFLMLFTFLPTEEVKELGTLKDQEINRAKEILAYEQTKLIHGKEAADRARDAAKAAFSSGSSDRESIPSLSMGQEQLSAGIGVLELFGMTSLCSSRSEARRLVQQGGASINGKKVDDIEAVIGTELLDDQNELVLRAGKKRFFRISVQG